MDCVVTGCTNERENKRRKMALKFFDTIIILNHCECEKMKHFTIFSSNRHCCCRVLLLWRWPFLLPREWPNWRKKTLRSSRLPWKFSCCSPIVQTSVFPRRLIIISVSGYFQRQSDFSLAKTSSWNPMWAQPRERKKVIFIRKKNRQNAFNNDQQATKDDSNNNKTKDTTDWPDTINRGVDCNRLHFIRVHCSHSQNFIHAVQNRKGVTQSRVVFSITIWMTRFQSHVVSSPSLLLMIIPKNVIKKFFLLRFGIKKRKWNKEKERTKRVKWCKNYIHLNQQRWRFRWWSWDE